MQDAAQIAVQYGRKLGFINVGIHFLDAENSIRVLVAANNDDEATQPSYFLADILKSKNPTPDQLRHEAEIGLELLLAERSTKH